MANVNIETVAEEAVENIEETMLDTVQKNGISKGEAAIVALATYFTFEGVKWVGRKIGKLIKKPKTKKNKTVKEDEVFDTPIAEIDEEENK